MQITLYTDGGSLNNPGQAAIGYLIYTDGNLAYKEGKAIGIASNNVAEYTALITGLTYIRDHYLSGHTIDKIIVMADSELMIRQVNGIYKVKHPDIKKLHTQVKILEMELAKPLVYSHVLREKNAEADALVKSALGR